MNQNNQKNKTKEEFEKKMDFYFHLGAILVELQDRPVDLSRVGSKEFTIVQFTSALLGSED